MKVLPTTPTTPTSPVPPGRGPLLADVAALAKVSPSLVSRILSGNAAVRARPETRTRVEQIAAEIGYVPHLLARSLRRSRAGALGLVVHDLGNPIFGEIVQGAQQRVARDGDVLLVADAASVADDTALRRLAGGGRVDGLLWQPADSRGIDERAAVAAQWLPVCLVNSRAAHGLPGVHLDDAGAIRLAVEHLLRLGHRRIGMVGGPVGSDNSRRRWSAYRRALRAAGVPLEPRWAVWGGWSAADGQQAGAALLADRPEVTAVVAANVVVASGVLSAAAALGLAVPGALSVVALHDLWFAERLSPPLTVVRLPLREMGWTAADALLRPEPAVGSRLVAEPAPQLILRASTAVPRADP